MGDKLANVTGGVREEKCRKTSKTMTNGSDEIRVDEEENSLKENGPPPEADIHTAEKSWKSEEAVQLMYGADLLMECARALKLPAAISAVACTIFHRFYKSVSPRSVSPIWVTAAALLLAGKHEGVRRRLRDVANVVHSRLVLREGWSNDSANCPLDYYGAIGYVWKQSIVKTELEVLAELGFRIPFETAHKFVLVFVNTLREKSAAGDWLDPGPNGGEQWRSLLQRAWSCANDVMRIPVCVTERTEDLACACIARAACEGNMQLPREWAAVFGGRESSIGGVDRALSLLYAAPPLRGAFRDLADAGIVEACQHGASLA